MSDATQLLTAVEQGWVLSPLPEQTPTNLGISGGWWKKENHAFRYEPTRPPRIGVLVSTV